MTRTPPMTVTRVRLWRWRRNPLRRHSDVVEAWIVLVGWVLALAVGVFAGMVAARSSDAAFTAREARLHPVSAVLTDDAARTPAAGTGYDDGRVWAAVRWTDTDGSAHTDRAKVYPGAPAGTHVTVWTNQADRVVPAPVTGAAADLQSALTGALVAPAAGALVWGAGWLVRGRLIRRRMAEWDEEWKQIGPRWGNFSGGRG
ncbi:Rv1733c family protein [Streptomyces cinerochromogenes]|uniref:Rv1733c family protein n=1 Tax=Streptomyces cinerochromogenes TaxID=66422 RepID=UPI0033BA41BF